MKKQASTTRAALAPTMKRVSPPVVRHVPVKRETLPAANDALPAPIGHNNPPGGVQLERGRDGLAELKVWLLKHTAIQNANEAKNCAEWIERTRITVEAEEKALTSPMRKRLDAIYTLYREVRSPLYELLKTLRARGTAYSRAEEARREAIAAEARRKAAQAEAEARAAERAEQDAIARADVGEEAHTATVTAAIRQADAAFGAFKRAERGAQIATRDVRVRLAPTLGRRALTMSSHEVLEITSLLEAVAAIGPTEAITKAVKDAAKAYRDEHGELPPGVTSTRERRL
jgi:hypothetical protein